MGDTSSFSSGILCGNHLFSAYPAFCFNGTNVYQDLWVSAGPGSNSFGLSGLSYLVWLMSWFITIYLFGFISSFNQRFIVSVAASYQAVVYIIPVNIANV